MISGMSLIWRKVTGLLLLSAPPECGFSAELARDTEGHRAVTGNAYLCRQEKPHRADDGRCVFIDAHGGRRTAARDVFCIGPVENSRY